MPTTLIDAIALPAVWIQVSGDLSSLTALLDAITTAKDDALWWDVRLGQDAPSVLLLVIRASSRERVEGIVREHGCELRETV